MIVYTRKRKRECVEAAARCADANAAPAQPASVHIQPHPAAPSAGAPQPHGTATAGPEPSARTRGAPVGRVRRRRDTLSEEEIGRVLAAVSHKDAPPNKIVKQYGGIPLRVEDICALLSPRAIDDTIIDCYMCLLRQRQDQWGGQRGYPRCHFLHTCFFALLTGLCHCKREYNPHRVQFVNYEALLDSECILVPINCNGNHWCLAAIYPGSRRIVCADSLSGNKEDDTTRFIFRVLARFMTEYSQGTNDIAGSGSDGAERPWAHAMANAPQQSNGYDCGIFVCCYAECLSAGQDFDFSQKEMSNIRACIAVELMCGKCFAE